MRRYSKRTTVVAGAASAVIAMLMWSCGDTARPVEGLGEDGPGVEGHVGDAGRFGVRALPTDGTKLGRVRLSTLRSGGYTRMAQSTAPNGKAIIIVAQEGVPDLVLARARNLLEFFLHPVPGAEFGDAETKAAIANSIADRGALLAIPTGADRNGNEPRFDAQPLYVDETPLDGSVWYLENDWNHRDAAFEEILHFVHDAGIGTDRPGGSPELQERISAAASQALEAGLWGIPATSSVNDWVKELRKEGSIPQEYIAAVVDSYYGLWAAYEDRPGGMWGIYCAKNRDEVRRLDPLGASVLESFLPPMLTGYEALIDPTFQGTFALDFDPQKPWTQKSQYLVEVTLTGLLPSAIDGNSADNILRGNRGDNRLDGGPGIDTAVFEGPRGRYVVRGEADSFVVEDSQPGGDGLDSLQSIEIVRFEDGDVPVETLLNEK